MPPTLNEGPFRGLPNAIPQLGVRTRLTSAHPQAPFSQSFEQSFEQRVSNNNKVLANKKASRGFPDGAPVKLQVTGHVDSDSRASPARQLKNPYFLLR